MDENIELLQFIYKNSEMGVFTIKELLKNLEDKDNKIKGLAKEELDSYENFKEESEELIEAYDYDVQKNKITSKIMSSIGISHEVNSDNSDSSIADMLIKGVSMGTIDMEKKINDYKNIVDKNELKFAKDFLEFQQDVITGLKKYL